MSGLQGKVVIVTGGSGGLGTATAACMAREGASVVVTGRDREEGEKAAAEVGGLFLRHDVTSEDDWRSVVDATVDRYGRSWTAWSTTAGIDSWSLIEHETLEHFEEVLKVNLTGIFLGLKAVIAPMRAAGGGSIVNIGSATGLSGHPLTSGYGVSKWGARGLTKIAAVELGRYRIRVNSVHPGLMYTPMTAARGVKQGEGNFPLSPLGRVGLLGRGRRGGVLPDLRRGRVHHGFGHRRRRRLDGGEAGLMQHAPAPEDLPGGTV